MSRLKQLNRPSARRTQRGAGIIETMIGILIGMIVLLVVYNVFALSESYKRTTVGVADMQVNGQFAQFLLSREIFSAGNGMSFALADLATCNNDWRLKPIPVLINAAATNNDTDDITVMYSNSPRIVHPAVFSGGAAIGATQFEVQSPNGFAVGDWVIATDRAALCELRQVTAVAPFSGPPDPLGRVNVTVSPGSTAAFAAASSRLINMGTDINRVEYTVRPRPTPNPYIPQLRSQDVNPGVAVQPVVPLASDVVLIKAQYGIDQTGANNITCWTPADNAGTCPLNGVTVIDYSAASLGSAASTAVGIGSIKAVRIAVVVRSNEPDPKNNDLTGQTQWLFNCSVNTNAGCPGRIQIDDTVLQDFFRYRVYETTIPLRNALWN